jgi:hypothetical protein
VCQDVLEQIGKVTDISRETGTIAGKIPLSALSLAVKIFLRIAKKGNITELSIQTNSVEGLITLNRAQNALTVFTKAMGADKRLAGKSTAGWLAISLPFTQAFVAEN